MADQVGQPAGKEETQIPVFTVLKKGSVLKNIFLNNPPPEALEPAIRSPREELGQEEEEKVLVGRHPDCHIVVDHPSISRFHMEIRVRPSLQKLSVVDLASVHGTWVSGNKIEPSVPVDLAEGDTVRLGASSRVYELHWVPLSSAFEWDDPLPALQEEPEQNHQAENCIPELDYFSFESWATQISSAPPMPPWMDFPSLSPVVEASGNQSPTAEASEAAVISNVPPLVEILSPPSSIEGKKKKTPEPEANAEAEASEVMAIFDVSLVLETLSSPSLITEGKKKITPEPEANSGAEASEATVIPDVPPILETLSCASLMEWKRKMTPKPVAYPGTEASEAMVISAVPPVLETLSSPSLMEGRRKTNPESEACPGAEASEAMVISVVPPVLETLSSPSLKDGKREVAPEPEASPEGEHLSLLIPEKQVMSSSLLSRRNKSISFLCVRMGRSRETVGSLTFDMVDATENGTVDGPGEVGDSAFLSDKENMTPETSRSRVLKKNHTGFQRSIFNTDAPLGGKDEGFLSDKENMTPEVSRSGLRTKNQMLLQRSVVNANANVDEKEKGFLSDKRNLTPDISGDRILKKRQTGLQISTLTIDGKEDGESVMSGISRSDDIKKNQIMSHRSELTIDAVFDGTEDEFLSDKENDTPQLPQLIRQGTIGKQEGDVYASDKENQTPQTSGDQRSKNNLSSNRKRIETEIVKRRVDRIPFQSLIENSPSKNSAVVARTPFHLLSEKFASKNPIAAANISTGNDNLLNHSQRLLHKSSGIPANQSVDQRHDKGVKMKWNIVADTSCFLNEESRKSLQLLQGLRGTHLIIPRMVVRELDCLKRRESCFRKTPKAASLALQWIEECMVKTSWWIHVQSSMESMPVAPTPPASPQVQCEDINEFHGSISNSMLFSTCGSMAEILSPTAEDHILDCALLFKKIKNDGLLVLLTNEVSLKIKAMAEGLLCESPKEFRESIVNPFSQRFLWAESSPRGPTWSCSDQVGQSENIYNCWPVMKTIKAAEGAKGLKLILLHNSHYAHANLVK